MKTTSHATEDRESTKTCLNPDSGEIESQDLSAEYSAQLRKADASTVLDHATMSLIYRDLAEKFASIGYTIIAGKCRQKETHYQKMAGSSQAGTVTHNRSDRR